MKRNLSIVPVLLVALLSACSTLSSANIVMVVTATPDARAVIVTVTDTPKANLSTAVNPTASKAPQVVSTSTQSLPTAVATVPSLTSAATQVIVRPTSGAVASNIPPTPTSGYFPTDTRQQIVIAQEDFQGGYMFWIQATQDIWVLLPTVQPKPGDLLTAPNTGEWRIYKDTFVDGSPEIDSSVVPPSTTLYQPRRGFGKLWRENPDLRTALGWAITPEFGLETLYVYQPGGTINAQNQWVPGPGSHFLISLGRETFQLSEPPAGQTFGTWKKVK